MTGALRGIKKRNSLHVIRAQREMVRNALLDALDKNVTKTAMRKIVSTQLSNRGILTRPNFTDSGSKTHATSMSNFYNVTAPRLDKYYKNALKHPPKSANAKIKTNRTHFVPGYKRQAKSASNISSMSVDAFVSATPIPPIRTSSKLTGIFTSGTGESKIQKKTPAKKVNKDIYTGKKDIYKPLTAAEKKVIAQAERLSARVKKEKA